MCDQITPDAATPIDAATLVHGVAELSAQDEDLARVVARWGHPPLWARPPGFATLVHIILEQQVSLASARAAFDRLVAATGTLTPSTLLQVDDTCMLAIGFSRQKRAYARGLAHAILTGQLDLDNLAQLPDIEARTQLIAQKGIGPWTADIYLLMALGRADIWPSGDLALAIAAQAVKQLPHRPRPNDLEELARPWRPWRSVAARILWHDYLSRRQTSPQSSPPDSTQ